MFCVGPISLMSEELLKHHGSFDKEISFESYGVRIRIASDSQDLIDEAIRAVSGGFGDKTSFTDDVGSQGSGHDFVVTFDGDHYLLFRNGEQVSYAKSKKIFFKNLNGRLRIEAAEYAKSKVFLHAGVVGWKGSAIVVPAKSFEGKSTLTAELVKNGAEYYSDEYAVIDELGNVHPFPRKISMRYFGATREKEVSVEEIGGRQGVIPLPVGMVLLTGFRKGGVWAPEVLGAAAGSWRSSRIPFR